MLDLTTTAALGLMLFSGHPADGVAPGAVPATERPSVALSDADRDVLGALIDARRRAVAVAGAAFVAHHPLQQWTTRFDGGGFSIEPDAVGQEAAGPAWSFGLELTGLGRGATQLERSASPEARIADERLTYAWGAGLEEWFVNGPSGLEHGFTLQVRPAGASPELTVELTVRGGLTPRVLGGARDVEFVDDRARAVVTYTGLLAFDADGAHVPARFEGSPSALHIVVDDSRARYPLTIDPVVQQAYLKASNTRSSAVFGNAVAISGDTVVIGSSSESSNATGVNGDENNTSAAGAGAAYVFRRNGTTWTQEAYLKASNTDANDHFGTSVAISGDRIAIGADDEDSIGAGVNGNQFDNSASSAGAVYVFVRTGTSWAQEAYIKASNPAAVDRFGFSVALDGSTLVVGAYQEDSNATGVNGNETNNLATNSGAAYVFVRSGGTWSQQAYLKASNTGASDEFGYSVAVSGQRIVVGARLEDSDATGINGDGLSNAASGSGAAYIFVRNGTTWAHEAYVKASNTGANDEFGAAVAISGDRCAIGAWHEDGPSVGINGPQGDGISNSGAVYTFVRSSGSWTQDAYIKSSNSSSSDEFGEALCLSQGMLLVGASREDSSATGINGNQGDGATDSGAAYLFRHDGAAWSQIAYIKASNTGTSDRFGDAVACTTEALVIGAELEDSNATGVNGIQTNNSTTNSGAAYVLRVPPGAPFCAPGVANSTGQPARMAAFGSTFAAANDMTLEASALPMSSFGFFLTSRTSGFVANPAGSQGNLCLGGLIGRYVGPGQIQNSGAAGSFDLELDLTRTPTPTGLVAVAGGETWHYQAWYRDSVGGVATSNFTDGYTILFR